MMELNYESPCHRRRCHPCPWRRRWWPQAVRRGAAPRPSGGSVVPTASSRWPVPETSWRAAPRRTGRVQSPCPSAPEQETSKEQSVDLFIMGSSSTSISWENSYKWEQVKAGIEMRIMMIQRSILWTNEVINDWTTEYSSLVIKGSCSCV